MLQKPFYSLLTLRKHLTRLNTPSSFPPAKHLDLGRNLFSVLKRVMNNGRSTDYFPLEGGTRQGDPLSAYLSILALETLLIQIRENAGIKGIIIDETEIKLLAYVYDGSL